MSSVVALIPADEYTNIAVAGTVTIKSGIGVFIGLVINKAVALSVTTIYDGIDATGTKIATITNPLALLQSQHHLHYNCRFTVGLTIVTSLADDITVMWR